MTAACVSLGCGGASGRTEEPPRPNAPTAAPAPTPPPVVGRILFPPGDATTVEPALTFQGVQPSGSDARAWIDDVPVTTTEEPTADGVGRRFTVEVPLELGISRHCLSVEVDGARRDNVRCVQTERVPDIGGGYPEEVYRDEALARSPLTRDFGRFGGLVFFALDASRDRLLIPYGDRIATWSLASSETGRLTEGSPPWGAVAAVAVDGEAAEEAWVLEADAPHRLFRFDLERNAVTEVHDTHTPEVRWTDPWQVMVRGERFWLTGRAAPRDDTCAPPCRDRSVIVGYRLDGGPPVLLYETQLADPAVLSHDSRRERLTVVHMHGPTGEFDAQTNEPTRPPSGREGTAILAYDGRYDHVFGADCTTAARYFVMPASRSTPRRLPMSQLGGRGGAFLISHDGLLLAFGAGTVDVIDPSTGQQVFLARIESVQRVRP